jgi:hypothetical protein
MLPVDHGPDAPTGNKPAAAARRDRSRAARIGLAAIALSMGEWPMDASGQGNRPPTGVYRCFMPSFTFSGGVTVAPAGEFTLLAGGKYKGLPNDPNIGDYRVNPGTQDIEWLSGPFAGLIASAKYVGVNSSGHTINMKMRVNNQLRELWCHTPA